MSNANNSINKIIAQSSKLDRSTSSVRFQIEKVFDDDDDGPEDSSNSKKVLDKTSSVPINFTSSTNSNESKKKMLFDQKTDSLTVNEQPGTYDTIEALPHSDHYRNLFSFTSSEPKTRPTLEALHGTKCASAKLNLASTIDLNSEMVSSVMIPSDQPIKAEIKPKTEIVKFGWIIGVLIRCVLNIFGVMLFLRLSWVTGQAGIGLACIIIIISTVVTILTSLSMSAICTNGEVKGGGTYYLISRSLGPEFGGAIGLIFSFVNAVAAAMYTIGFAETVRDLLKEYGVKIFGTVIDGESVNIVRIIGVITMTIILGIALIGMRGETIVQITLLITLSASLLDFFIGSLMPVTSYKRRHGFEGYSWKIIKENFGPRFTNGETFQHVFGVFFPSVTGILAGANISGNLKNPSKAIPLGTNVAIGITTFVYLAFCVISGCTTHREIALDYYERRNGSAMQIVNCTIHWNDKNCKSGLVYNYQTMKMIAAFGPLITAGIFAATLSSALASLVGAPKIFQAVCRDMIFPRLKYFAVGNGKSDEPIRAYFLTYLVAVSFTAIGELNKIAPIISNFFLMTYALVNYACFDASLAKASGWRPGFRYYNKWLALTGAISCVAVMFIINWWAALITFLVMIGIYLYVRTTKPEINWGSTAHAHTYRRALDATHKLDAIQEHVKNFRPQMLVFTGNPIHRSVLVDLCSLVTHGRSLMICGNVIIDDPTVNLPYKQNDDGETWLKQRTAKAFYQPVVEPSLRQGAIALLQCVGVGKMRPNVAVLGFKNDWTANAIATIDYFNIIHDALHLKYGIGILRLQTGLDESDFFQPDLPDDEDDDDDDNDESVISSPLRRIPKVNNSAAQQIDGLILKNAGASEGISLTMDIFGPKKTSADTIDVWWLFDDGGLTLLLPYLLQRRKRWRNCQLRIFSCVPGDKTDAERQHVAMASLLTKFRIKYTDLHVLHGLNKQPNERETEKFQQLLQAWHQNNKNLSTTDESWRILDIELDMNKEKIKRGLNLHEYLIEHSSQSTLIIVTLPIPRKQSISAGLYLAYLDAISYNLPPLLFLRGNQKNVLTYYS
ncbi:unnamed protein product [Adineta ricciae]|uniref:Uncharacterized protein n=1 Tax=Adineta ricciae TaxID=249248 RepID=A0A813TXY2_ADIRI|nr:unnamed protein product [Adineta ricciae]CAF0949805.1 unnamed protein product [Adineta ricciae]